MKRVRAEPKRRPTSHYRGIAIVAAMIIMLANSSVAGAVRAVPRVGKIMIGPNTQVSNDFPDDPHFEVVLAADPKRPGNLLAGGIVFLQATNRNKEVAYLSSDGGQTWVATLIVDGTFDPAVAYGPDGTAYFSYFGKEPDGTYNTYIYRSKDGGHAWLGPVRLPILLDRDFMVADESGGKYDSRLYLGGHAGITEYDGGMRSSFTVYRSFDGGATFQAPKQLATLGDGVLMGNSAGVVLSDGTVLFVFNENLHYSKFGEKNDTQLKVVTSQDGGETFSKAVVVADKVATWSWAASSVPVLAVDRSGPFRDRVYAVHNELLLGRVQIVFTYSADKGKTWSTPIIVNDDRPPADPSRGPDQFMPWVAVNKDGVVGVMWYDRRDSTNNLDWTVRFAASLDGGETFLPSVRVSEASFVHGKDNRWPIMAMDSEREEHASVGSLRLRIGIHPSEMLGGDTAGIVADANGTFHLLWVDNRTGVSQVWTAPVTVSGRVIRNGDEESAELDDVSAGVLLTFSNMHYDRATNTLYVDARMQNISDGVILGPVKARVLSLASDIGIPVVKSSDNGEHWSGAVWDFTPFLNENKLRPKEALGLKHLQFQLSDLRPLTRPPIGNGVAWHLIDIRAKVLGKRQ